MRATDFVGPLHFLSLDHHSADLGFTILSRSERDNKVCTFFSIWFQETTFWINNELRSRVCGKESCEFSIALKMVVELEGDTGCLVEMTLNDDHIINLRLESFEDYIEFPSTTTALVDYEFGLALEWSQWLKSHLEAKRIIWAHQSIVLLLKEY